MAQAETDGMPSDRGVCDLCEQAPVAPGDCMCAPCRAEVDTITDEVTDPVERALNAHWKMEPLCTAELTICRCTARFSGGAGYHRRHLAEAIYEALGLDGPSPWDFGERSPSRKRFDENGRIMADNQRAGDERRREGTNDGR